MEEEKITITKEALKVIMNIWDQENCEAKPKQLQGFCDYIFYKWKKEEDEIRLREMQKNN